MCVSLSVCERAAGKLLIIWNKVEFFYTKTKGFGVCIFVCSKQTVRIITLLFYTVGSVFLMRKRALA